MHSAARCLILAGATLAAAQAGSSQVNCITAVGPQPVSSVETTTAESTSTVSIADATTTTVVTETMTAAAATETDTTTVEVTTTTTEEAVTDIYFSTSTEIDTATTTVTQTETTTETVSEVETTTSTSVVPTPSGFVPIADTQNGYPARKRDSHRRHCHKPVLKPSVYPTPIAGTYSAAAVTSSSSVPSSSSSSTVSSDGPCTLGDHTQYPTSVGCSATTTTQATVTETSTASTTITPAPVTTTATATVTSTSTEVPRASTTLTTTETSTTTSTATETTTTTETSTSTSTETATATSYAACQADNILSSYNGMSIVNVFNRGQGSATVYDFTSANTPEECCVKCVNTAGCTGTIWRTGATYCLLLYGNGRACASQSDNAAQFITSGTDAGYVLSNGLCGYQEYSGIST